uniref:Methyltransferase type 11 domain-containing protein n=1 Tax=Chlorobium chlorochromatii (strain CaD3) TaxID=340177 RepID=Q3ASK9_CHLCH
MQYCHVCGGTLFNVKAILWDELIKDWQLSPKEVNYINQQQGGRCSKCLCSIRSIVLAKAITNSLGYKGVLINLLKSSFVNDLSILEINQAGNLSRYLRLFKNYTFGAYPDVDMHNLPYKNNTFDLIVHSDTLEHVANPIHALSECYRVLKPNGFLCYTVPIIIGRLSRNRSGLKKSYHGTPNAIPDDYVVCTEFGADAWTFLLEAGFDSLSMYSFHYPAGIALAAKKREI